MFTYVLSDFGVETFNSAMTNIVNVQLKKNNVNRSQNKHDWRR